MLKVGIVGFGRMGQIRYEEIVKISGAEIVCIYEPRNLDELPSNNSPPPQINQYFLERDFLRDHQNWESTSSIL
jgi:hypothetical protein